MGIFQLPRCCTPTLLAKIATVFSTVAWSVIVLHSSNALDAARYPVYDTMVAVLDEDVWAYGMLAVACTSALSWVTRFIHHRIELVANATLCFFWLYLTASVYYWYPQLPPTGVPGVLTVCGLSIFAFLSRDRPRGPNPL
jgi:hypothetical protein